MIGSDRFLMSCLSTAAASDGLHMRVIACAEFCSSRTVVKSFSTHNVLIVICALLSYVRMAFLMICICVTMQSAVIVQ